MRAPLLFLALSLSASAVAATSCGDDDCSVTLTCPTSSASAGGGGTTNTGGTTNAGGAGGTMGTAGGGNGGGGVDTIKPRVLAITPANGTVNVRVTEPIVVTFSEPMNTDSGNVAYDPEEIPTEPWETSWSPDGTTLTIDAKLTYPTSGDPNNVPNKVHRFTITENAQDLAGNPLDTPAAGEFTLARQVVQELPIIFNAPNCGNVNVADGAGEFTFIGCGEGGSTGTVARMGYATFDITAVPDNILEWQSARIAASIRGITGDPGKYGDVVAEHIFFDTINNDVPTTATLNALGVFIDLTPAPMVDDPVEVDVLVALQDDLANRATRNNKSQYRFLIPGWDTPDLDGTADFVHVYNTVGTTHLEAIYLLESL